MQSIKDVNQIIQPKQELLETYTCDGCGEFVERKKMIIPIGPRKGEVIIANLGCKCESIRLAEKAIKQRDTLRISKVQELFDKNSLINKSLQKAKFSNYRPTNDQLHQAKIRMMQYAKEFSPEESKNLLLVGSYGTGKSHLSLAVTKELSSKYKCLFLSVPKLFTKIKSSFGNKDFSEDDVLDMIQNVDLLVLDDIGTEYTNKKSNNDSWTHTKLFEVLDSRSGKPTIFTTNLSSNELEDKINERNLSRLLDNTEVIKMNGKDYRRKEF